MASAATINAGALSLLLQLAQNEYYSVPGTVGKGSHPATRGAQYALERRINQIRQQQGATEPWNPQEGHFQPFSDSQQKALNSYFNVLQTGEFPHNPVSGANSVSDQLTQNIMMQGADPFGPATVPAITAAQIGFGGHSGDLGPGAGVYTTGPQDVIDQFGGTLQAGSQATQNDIDDLHNFLSQRYQADAMAAGTLSGTAQSKNALEADVNAGQDAGLQALRGDQNTINTALGPNFNTATSLYPAKPDLGAAANQGTAPGGDAAATNPVATLPEQQPSANSLVSGQNPQALTAAKRKAILQSQS